MPKLTTLKPRVATLETTVGRPRSKTRQPRDYDKPWSSERGTTTQQGYGWAWQKLRKLILERDLHLCQCDRCQGGELRVTLATHVDHIVPKATGGSDDPSNLRALSAECHKRITMEQFGKTPRPSIGVDGWPTE